MSRYVEKKHGLVIGSDNWFFYRDKDGEYQDFPCILSIRGFSFDNPRMYGHRIHTPAQQLLVHYRRLKKGEYIDVFGRDCVGQIVQEPGKWLTKWLDMNAPGWGTPPPGPRENLSIFFQKRGHAVALCKEVETLLAGLPSAKKYL